MKELLHFAHGNGFPARCYSQLLKQLSTQYDCFYVDQIGHNPLFPVTDNWPFLVDELLDNIKKKANQPVIAVGHSLGGVLSLMAAVKEPSLFKSLIMIDSPLLGRVKSNLVWFAKTIGFIDRITPAFRTQGRRTFWKEKNEVMPYLKTRDLFKTFTPECLQDYMDYGLTKNSTGYTLRYDRDIECAIFRTVPHNLRQYEKKLTVPAALIYGDKSRVVTNSDISYMKKHYHILSVEMHGSHMLPFESPIDVANQIITITNNVFNEENNPG